MANHVLPLARKAFADGSVDLLADTIKLIAVSSGYTQNDADQFVSAIPGGAILSRTAALTTKATVAGTFTSDTTKFVAVPAGPNVTGVLLFKDTGVDASSPLLAWYDHDSSGNPLALITNGLDLAVNPNGLGWFTL